MLSRRIMIALPAALGGRGLLRATAVAGARRVAVVFPAALEPCTEAVEGFRLRLAGGEVSLDLLDVGGPAFAAEVMQELARKPAVIVAVGSEAIRAVLSHEPPVKTVSTMTLEADHAAESGRVSAGVYLDIPIRTLVAELRGLFPGKPRVGVIRNPRRGDPSGTQIRSQGAEMNSVQIADCATPDELLPVFLALRKKVDFVICLPDGALYNGATVRPLIMASLEHRLPIVGFSPAFLRAGAAVAVYPDYRGIGQQTADLVRRCLEAGECTSWESPRKVDVAVNAKVLRMLGIEPAAAARPDLVILR